MNKPLGSYRFYVALGALILGIPMILDVFSPRFDLPSLLLMAFVIAGSLLLCVGIYVYQQQRPAAADERFVLHRLRASRFGLIAGLLTIMALVLYHAVVEEEIPWDLVFVAGSMALGKVAGMVYFRATG